MKPHTQSDRPHGRVATALVAAAAIAVLAMKIHAEVTISFASTQFGTNLQSDGSAMDSSFTFELGTFANGFAPTAGNTDQWLANWTPVTSSSGTPHPDASTQYGTVPTIFGPTDGFSGEVTLDHNNAPFVLGQQGYIFGYDSLTGEADWILLTNTDPAPDEWTYTTATGGIAFLESWTVGTATGAIVGNINFTDGKGDFISMQTGAVSLPPAVPEPSTAAFLAAAAIGLGLRRRRKRG